MNEELRIHTLIIYRYPQAKVRNPELIIRNS